MIVVTTASAYALELGTTTNVDIQTNTNLLYKDDGQKKDNDREYNNNYDGMRVSNEARITADFKGESRSYNRIKSWIIESGTVGEVTATTATTLTIKTAEGKIYTVTTADATIRRDTQNVSASSIVVGDKVFVVGIKNETSIVASFILTAKAKEDLKPTAEEKSQAYFGVITAKSDTALTVVSANNTSYTVTLASDSQLWINKEKQTNLSGFSIGDNVMVQGTLSGSAISAKKLIALHLPTGTIVGKVTASSASSITVTGTDNKSYTILTTDASIKAKGKDGTLALGDTVIAKGDLAGTTLTAETVSETKANGGFFHKFGLFFKGVFGNKK